ncbi:MAG TPA: hypothetical protein VHV57_20430 [Acidimicrobiales bacterium]|nr:hypothetical protein [Acidimicrobiales bacterium]
MSVHRNFVARYLPVLATVPLAVGIWGLVVSPGAGAQLRDATATTTTTTSSDAQSGNTNSYTLSAAANALDVLVTDPSLPLSGDLAIEVGPFGASALVNSLGESMADAGAPYAPSITSLPGVVAGIGAGLVPPLPPIPGYVSASYPTSSTNSQSQLGYDISATTSANSAQGIVSLGVQPSGSPSSTFFANAQTTANNDGSVSVSAAAGVDALDLGQLFDIGNVSSSLSMTQQAGQQPKVTSNTNLGQITLLGKATGLGSSGLSVLGINTPINLNTQVLSTLNKVLGGLGVKFTYLPETFTYSDGTSSTGSKPDDSKTLQSIDSGALQIIESRNLPSQGLTTVTITLGHITLNTSDAAGFSTSGDGGLSGLDTGSSPLNTLTSPGVTGEGLSSLGPTTSATPTGAPTSPSKTLQSAPAYEIEKGPRVGSVYLVLVLAGLGMLLISQAVRYLAVRLALGSRRR